MKAKLASIIILPLLSSHVLSAQGAELLQEQLAQQMLPEKEPEPIPYLLRPGDLNPPERLQMQAEPPPEPLEPPTQEPQQGNPPNSAPAKKPNS
jgi:hypothetical protein